MFCCNAVYSAKSWQPLECGRHGMSAFLQVDPGDLHLACGGAVCCPVCPWRLPCHGVGWSPAHCLGIPHHLVCKLSVTLLGLPKLQHRYGADIVLHGLVLPQVHHVQRCSSIHSPVYALCLSCYKHVRSPCIVAVSLQSNVLLTHLGVKALAVAGDLSRNNWWVAALAFGEGWHNNHHAFEFSARHGLEKWQIDITWLVISALQKVGLATNVKLPSERQKSRLAFE